MMRKAGMRHVAVWWQSVWPQRAWWHSQRWRVLLLFAGVLIPLCVFGILAEDVLENEGFVFDQRILLLVHGLSTPLLDRTMLFFSLIGSGRFVVPIDCLIFTVLAWRRRWSGAFLWALAVGGASLLDFAAKHVFGRTRPDLWISIAPEETFSFPSGHAMGTSALVAGLIVLTWHTRWRWPVVIAGSMFVVLVGLSRVYLGVHYPSDVLAGWAASMAWVFGLCVALYGRATKPMGDSIPLQSDR